MRESIRGFSDAILEQTGGSGATATVAGELAAVRDLVAGNADLRAVLSDPGVPAHSRRGLLDDLFSRQLAAETLQLLEFCVEVDRAPDFAEDVEWLATRTAAARDALRPVGPAVLGRHAAEERLDGYAAAVLAPVRDQGRLSDVEDELFRFGRIVAGSPELLDALTGRDRPAEGRAAVVRTLLADKAGEASVRLAAYASTVGRPRDYLELIDAIVARVSLETRRRIAEVRAAASLTGDQEQRLAAALGRMTGQDVEVRVLVDPAVLGGFVATMGDTVVDGSVRHRLDLLRERLVHTDALQTNEGAA